MPKPKSVDDYIASFPPEVRGSLETLRTTISSVLPTAEQVIRYDIPTFRLDGRNIVHFAGWKDHLSLYPVVDLDAAQEERVSPYRAGKGTLRFSLEAPVPVSLVEEVVGLLLQRHRGRKR